MSESASNSDSEEHFSAEEEPECSSGGSYSPRISGVDSNEEFNYHDEEPDVDEDWLQAYTQKAFC